MKTFLPFLFVVLSLAGCSTARRAHRLIPISRDSTYTRYETRHVTVYDTLRVQLPQESSMIQTLDSMSHLETSSAVSDAWLTPDGRLNHTLQNKPSVPIAVPHDTVFITRDSIIYKERPIELHSEQDPQVETMPEQKHCKLLEVIGNILMLVGAIPILYGCFRYYLRKFTGR